MEQISPYYWLPLALAATWFAYTFLFSRERLPDVEFLRISDKPGKAGDASDVQAFLDDSLSAIMKGYRRYSKLGKHFLLRTPKQVYMIVASSFLEEVRKAPETHLSQPAAANIIFQTRHTFHPALEDDSYHFDVVKIKLTQALAYNIPDLVDEAKLAFDVELGKASEWTEVTMYTFATKLITRVANRMLVGQELCRNDEFLHYSGTVTGTTFNSAVILRNYPEFMKGLMMYFMSDRKNQQRIARKYLTPIFKERIAQMNAVGRGEKNDGAKEDKPTDAGKYFETTLLTASRPCIIDKAARLVQWLLDITPPEKMDPDILVQRMIHINVTAIHAPAVTWTELMYDLCRHPEIHEELRSEIAEVLGKSTGGNPWTKVNMDRLVKMDSFMRESVRLTPMSAIKMERLAVQDFRLSDGTLIPRGTSVGIIAHGRHIDEDYVKNATTFDAFRFARARAEVGMETQHTFAQTSGDNLLFGMGRHACPGRHFASVLLKMLLVFTLVKYDVKFVDGKPLPQGRWTQKFRNPDMKASIAWKRREIEERFANIFA